MPRWLNACAAVAAVLAVGAWAFLSTFPFFAFELREKIWKPRRPSLVCQPASSCNLAPENFTMTQEEIDMHAIFSPYLGEEDTERIFAAVQEGYELRRQQAGRPIVLHIGPADLPVAEEIEMYSRISATMNATEVIFVEPHPGQRERLREKIRQHFGGELSMRILPAAVCPDGGHDVTFYRISERFFQDFGGERWYFTRYWSGLNKANFITELQYYNKNNQAQLMKALNYFPPGFPETDEDWFPYIEEIPVQCHTPQGLLRELLLEPSAVTMLIMDSEGYDTELMKSFMGMGGFAPNFIMFEWHLHGNEPAKLGVLLGLVRELHARGYEVHRHNRDVVAFK